MDVMQWLPYLARVFALGFAFRVLGQEWLIGGSIGIAIHPRNGADLKASMANADIAVYCVKQNGGNAYRLY